MSLPSVNAPIYTLILPSTGEKIKYRPYLVKEEKLLALAIQEGTVDALTNALINVIDNCTMGKVKAESVAFFDIEYIFLKLRSKAVGGKVELSFKCGNVVEDAVCGHVTKTELDLDTIEVVIDPNVQKKVILRGDIGLVLKYPTLETMISIEEGIAKGNPNIIYDKLSDFVECVFEGDNVTSNIDSKEFAAWIDNFSEKELEGVKMFIDSLPRVQATVSVKCAKCGHEESIELKGLRSFLE